MPVLFAARYFLLLWLLAGQIWLFTSFQDLRVLYSILQPLLTYEPHQLVATTLRASVSGPLSAAFWLSTPRIVSVWRHFHELVSNFDDTNLFVPW